jgi:hypothetical protein
MNKKASNGLMIVGIIVIIAVIGIVIYFATQTTSCGDSSGNMDVHYYDANGKEICSPEPLTTIGMTPTLGRRGVSTMAITVKATNGASSVPLSCQVFSALVNGASGTPFDISKNTQVKSLPVGGVQEWTSNNFAIAGYESAPTPDIFNITIKCDTGVIGQPSLYASDSIPFYIGPDGIGSFIVEILPPEDIPALYCGDGTCTSSIGETSTTCPQDCTSLSSVFFRTTSTSYVLGSAIGYTASCGGLLTKYGFDSYSCRTETNATCPIITGYTRVLGTEVIPDGITDWSTTAPCLYSTATGMSLLFKVASTSGEPTSCPVGRWIEIRYTTGSSYASSVSNQASTINSNKEIMCP